MVLPPPCRRLGRQCRELDVTLHVCDTTTDSPLEHDGLTTWLLGHTERITFGQPFHEGGQILVDATMHVGCKYLDAEGSVARCRAHGYTGPAPAGTARTQRPSPRLNDDRFIAMYNGSMRELELPHKPAPRRALPVVQGTNPCEGAPCRTADNRRGAACCRDLTVDVVLPDVGDPLELLLRSRTSPYLCKVVRASPEIVECEVITRCGYLGDDGVGCSLHGRTRPDGKQAKPGVCSRWPEIDQATTTHPGCRLAPALRGELATR